MGDALLDYRNAWRWLLPVDAQQHRVAVAGLNTDEKAFWRAKGFDVGFICGDASAEGLLINADEADVDSLDSMQGLRWVAVWGNGAAVRGLLGVLSGFSTRHCYALLPAGQPRVVVPLSSPGALAAGLRLHRPGRFVARIALAFALLLARLEFYWPLQKKVLLIANRGQNMLPAGTAQAGFTASGLPGDFALYLGTPEPNRKTVVLPVPLSDRPCIIKSGDNPLACAAVRNEAAALGVMQKTSLHGQVPAILAFQDAGAQVSLVQTYRQRRWQGKKRQQKAVRDFLCSLGTIETGKKGIADCLSSIPDNLSPEMQCLKMRLASLPPDTELVVHRSHGDFAPWNCAWTRQGLFVFDWEASQANGLGLSDAFYYVLAPLRLVHQIEDGEYALKALEEFITPMLEPMQLSSRSWHWYLALWLIGQPSPSRLYCSIATALERAWQ